MDSGKLGLNKADQLTYEAIKELYEENTKTFRIKDVYNQIIKQNDGNPIDINMKDINNSIRKLRLTLTRSETTTNQRNENKDNKLKKVFTEEPLLDLEHVEATYIKGAEETKIIEYTIRTKPKTLK